MNVRPVEPRLLSDGMTGRGRISSPLAFHKLPLRDERRLVLPEINLVLEPALSQIPRSVRVLSRSCYAFGAPRIRFCLFVFFRLQGEVPAPGL
jgi:hypothetical protein